MSAISFDIVPDALHPNCKPYEILNGILENDGLPTFAFFWGMKDGDCHEIALALCSDLKNSSVIEPDSWRWVTANCRRIGSLARM
jgi:hypothetical protein